MDINDIALGLFLIASAGSIISVICLIVSVIKKNGKNKLCTKLIIGFVALAIVCMIIPAFSDNSLTSQERKVLSKDYSQLTEDEKITLSSMQASLKGDDRKKHIKDLRRLFIQEHVVLGMNKSEAEKFWNEEENYRKRKESGQLTENEKEQEKQYEKNAEKFNDKVKEYMDGEKKIQENIDKIITTDKKYQYMNKVIVKGDMVKDTFNLTIDMISLSKSTVGEVAAIRNIMVDKVLEVVKPNNIKIELMNNDKYIDTYTFTVGKGWDKEVKSMD